MSVSIVSTRASSWCIKTHDLTSSWCLFVPIFVSLMKIISRISQNDLHILHNGHICQTCKIIRFNIELTILAFILPTSGHTNFECQHMSPCFLVKFTYQETSLLAKIIEDRWLILVHHLCFYSKTNKTSSAMLLGTNQDNNIIFAVFICTWWVRYKPEYTPPRLWILDAMARTIFTTYA